MAESLTLNSGTTSSFTLTNEANGIMVVSHDYPSPPLKPVFASSIDTEGALLAGIPTHENRTISLEVEVYGATSETVLGNLQKVLALIEREGGTLTYVNRGGLTVVFDLVTLASYQPTLDVVFSAVGVARVAFSFTALPYGRGTAVTLADHTETSLPALVFTETSIAGDVPALGKIVVDEDDADDQAWLVWGQRQRYYTSASSAALFIQAEGLTPQGGSVATAGAAGASGSGTNVVRNTDLTTSFVSVLSGQLSGGGGGAYLSHVGTYRVFARVYCPTSNTGTVSVALEWAEGDFRRVNRNVAVTYDTSWEGSFRLLDLGQASLTEVAQGTQRWEPRIIARSSVAGDEIDLDWLLFLPVDEGAGEVASVESAPAPTAFVARDEFGQAFDATFTGTSLPVGGTWTAVGDADDFTVTGSGTLTRAATSDGLSGGVRGRLLYASSPTPTNVAAQVFITRTEPVTAMSHEQSVIARYTDTNNFIYLLATADNDFAGYTLVRPYKVVAGVTTALDTTRYVHADLATSYVGLRLVALSNGQWQTWAAIGTNGTYVRLATGYDGVLATGGTLASGKVGLMDGGITGVAETRTYDNFAAWAPPIDAALFASQSLEIRHDQVIREDSTGAIWTAVSSYAGDYAFIPPTGPAGRTNQFVFKASRNVPGFGADSGIDDISARITVTPRYLTLPS